MKSLEEGLKINCIKLRQEYEVADGLLHRVNPHSHLRLVTSKSIHCKLVYSIMALMPFLEPSHLKLLSAGLLICRK